MIRRRRVLAATTAFGVGAFTLSAGAQGTWPNRPVRWIVPWAPGGAADVTARTIAQKLTEKWGQQVNIDNRPGGNTVIGAVEAMRAPPDGYTLFQPLSSTLTVNPFAYSKLPYDPLKDFTHIGLMAGVPLVIMGSEALPAKTLPEVLALAKSRPDFVTVGAAVGSQLAVEQWMRDWGVKLRYVAYKSGADITKALLAGEVHLGVDGIPNNLPHIKAGKIKGLAVNTAKRVGSLEEAPTLDELGIKHSEPTVWHGLLAPAGLPPQLLRKIEADMKAVMALPDVQEKLAGLGLEPMWLGPREFVARIRAESARIRPLVKELGIKMD